jgi:hypothetical protein
VVVGAAHDDALDAFESGKMTRDQVKAEFGIDPAPPPTLDPTDTDDIETLKQQGVAREQELIDYRSAAAEAQNSGAFPGKLGEVDRYDPRSLTSPLDRDMNAVPPSQAAFAEPDMDAAGNVIGDTYEGIAQPAGLPAFGHVNFGGDRSPGEGEVYDTWNTISGQVHVLRPLPEMPDTSQEIVPHDVRATRGRFSEHDSPNRWPLTYACGIEAVPIASGQYSIMVHVPGHGGKLAYVAPNRLTADAYIGELEALMVDG